MDCNGKSVLVIGGCGFLGHAVSHHLAISSANVLIVDLPTAKFDWDRFSTPVDSDIQLIRGDATDRVFLTGVLESYSPNFIVDLSGITDCSASMELSDYRNNYLVAENILQILSSSRKYRPERIIFTSTQLVKKPECGSSGVTDYSPVNLYAVSKIMLEFTAKSLLALGVDTLIVRPTNLWGPGHRRYKNSLYKAINKNLLIVCKNPEVVKTYGYVENVAQQYLALLEANFQKANFGDRIFYCGDAPMLQRSWLELQMKIHRNSRSAKPWYVPIIVLNSAELVNRLLAKFLGVSQHLHKETIINMQKSYICPTESTISVTGVSPIPQEECARRTSLWVKSSTE